MLTAESHLDNTIYNLILELSAIDYKEQLKKDMIECLEAIRAFDGCEHLECRLDFLAQFVGMAMTSTDVPKLVRDAVMRVFERANKEVEKQHGIG